MKKPETSLETAETTTMTDSELEEALTSETESPSDVETTDSATEPRSGKIVHAVFVNVRTQPSTQSESIEVLNIGDKVTILGTEGQFTKVSLKNGIVGYVCSECVKEV